MSFNFQVLGSTSAGSSPSLLLHTDQDGIRCPLYLFEAPDGLARAALEHRWLRPSRGSLKAIFGAKHRSLNGACGLLFRSRQDGGFPVHIMGPVGAASRLQALEHIMAWKHPQACITEVTASHTPVYQDEHVSVEALLEHGSSPADPSPGSSPASCEATAAPTLARQVQQPTRIALYVRDWTHNNGGRFLRHDDATLTASRQRVAAWRVTMLERQVAFIVCVDHKGASIATTKALVAWITRSDPSRTTVWHLTQGSYSMMQSDLPNVAHRSVSEHDQPGVPWFPTLTSQLLETDATFLSASLSPVDVAPAPSSCLTLGRSAAAVTTEASLETVSDDGQKGYEHMVNNSNTRDVRVTFLGTGSAEPSKHRGGSCIWLTNHDKGDIVLDVGEGSLAQMRHIIGTEGTRLALLRLRLVFVSHKHADHCVGLLELLEERCACFPELGQPLIIAPSSVTAWLSRSMGAGWEDAPAGCFTPQQANQSPAIMSDILMHTGIHELRLISVIHCHDSWGIKLAGPGWSLGYSGDTRPCTRLVDAFRGVQVLIHEATFESELQSHADKKRHSTIDEAVAMAHQAHAKYLIATHFSQRYPTAPKLAAATQLRNLEAAAAFDGLSFTWSQLPELMQEFGLKHHEEAG
eukprot:TRINITY_DN9978_c0_g1_i1.p1 TRINITY_DN9978_c0_g1~~TRINITY_DN9978_c0_g1_i1.p1  ORF type:complete len:635 (+),score=105.66 TRINITY_DN9978_c0_g1_i1:90-1994(+)